MEKYDVIVITEVGWGRQASDKTLDEACKIKNSLIASGRAAIVVPAESEPD